MNLHEREWYGVQLSESNQKATVGWFPSKADGGLVARGRPYTAPFCLFCQIALVFNLVSSSFCFCTHLGLLSVFALQPRPFQLSRARGGVFDASWEYSIKLWERWAGLGVTCKGDTPREHIFIDRCESFSWWIFLFHRNQIIKKNKNRIK